MKRAFTADNFRRLSRRRLPRAVYEYVEGGAEDELTVARSREGFQHLEFARRSLVDVSRRDQRTTVLGTAVASPIVLSPVGLAGVVNPAGERAAARAAADRGIIATIGSQAMWSIEEIAASGVTGHWFQIYIWKDHEVTRR